MATSPDQRLQGIRNSLLELHKTLVEAERVSYEQAIGPITSPNHFLNLLTHDPWFAWLHPLSQLIVAMDERLEAEEPLTDPDVEPLLNQARRLLIPTEGGEGYSQHYFEALQREPDVILAHAKATGLLNEGGARRGSPT